MNAPVGPGTRRTARLVALADMFDDQLAAARSHFGALAEKPELLGRMLANLLDALKLPEAAGWRCRPKKASRR